MASTSSSAALACLDYPDPHEELPEQQPLVAGETAKLCRALLDDLHEAERQARRIATMSSRTMATARAIGTRACQIAERAREAEHALVRNLQATATAWSTVERAVGAPAERRRGGHEILDRVQQIAATLQQTCEAANRAHQVALHATVAATVRGLDGMTGRVTRTAVQARRTVEGVDGLLGRLQAS